MLFHVAFHSSSCSLQLDRNVPWLVLFSTEAEQLWDIVILSAGDVAYNPQLVGFPKQDILHVCTSIKDRAATISDFFD